MFQIVTGTDYIRINCIFKTRIEIGRIRYIYMCQVKAALGPGVKTATPQQIRQLTLQQQLLAQRKLPAQKVAQLGQVMVRTI